MNKRRKPKNRTRVGMLKFKRKMKKKVFKTMAAVVCIAAAGMGGMKAYNAANLSKTDMLLTENVEALAEDEHGSGLCYKTITTKDGAMVLYCQTCTYIPGTDAWNSGTGNCN